MTLFTHELRQSFKTLLVWAFTVGVICWACILLYKSVEDQLATKAEIFSNMGSMTRAFGMDELSIASLDGYFGTQITMIFGLGVGMFAAMQGAASLSKEEEGHTSEFLHTLPYGRLNILVWKYLSLLCMLLIFNLIVVGLEALGIWQVNLDFSFDLFLRYHAQALLMQVEIVSLAFLVSAVSRKKQIGLSLGLVLLLYVMDVMGRIVSNIEDLNYLTPYHFASGADVFSQEKLEPAYHGVAFILIAISIILGAVIYQKKDLSD